MLCIFFHLLILSRPTPAAGELNAVALPLGRFSRGASDSDLLLAEPIPQRRTPLFAGGLVCQCHVALCQLLDALLHHFSQGRVRAGQEKAK